ncbi:hypothetical protein SRRS_07510 [Sporomusa rhizae]|uniref:energy transducer TonB n=1 Tax=Sporomusa rhizae TaxID=357999 RepID=UPI00352BBB43
MRKIIIFTVLFLFTFGLVYANDNTTNSDRNSQKKQPVLLYSINPEYPSEARANHLEGDVLLRITISVEGKVSNVEVAESSGHDILDEAAVNAVSKWRFIPARADNGQTIVSAVDIPIVFRLMG